MSRRDWTRERWRRLYLTEALHKNTWGVLARALEAYLVKRALDDGFLARSTGELRDALRPCCPAEAELTEQAIETLLADGFLEEREDGVFVKNLPEAQGDEPRQFAQAAPASPKAPSPKGRGGWAGKTPEERSSAARRAAQMRWGRDASTHALDASATHQATHPDASSDASATHQATHPDASERRIGDASGARAVSGQVFVTEEVFEPTNQIIQTHARDASTHASDACATHAHEASGGDAFDASSASARVPKPTKSPLAAKDIAQLEVDCPGMPRAFAELAIRDWLSEPSDPADLRFPRQWRTHAIKLVRGTWRMERRRRELLSALEGGATPEAAGPAPVTPEEAAKAARDLAVQKARQMARQLARMADSERSAELTKLEELDPEQAKAVRRFLEPRRAS